MQYRIQLCKLAYWIFFLKIFLFFMLKSNSILKCQNCGVVNAFAYSETVWNSTKSFNRGLCTLSFIQAVGK